MTCWHTKIRLRIMSDGKWIRLHPGGFGVWFPTGPYETFATAIMAPKNYFAAIDALRLDQDASA